MRVNFKLQPFINVLAIFLITYFYFLPQISAHVLLFQKKLCAHSLFCARTLFSLRNGVAACYQTYWMLFTMGQKEPCKRHNNLLTKWIHLVWIKWSNAVSSSSVRVTWKFSGLSFNCSVFILIFCKGLK